MQIERDRIGLLEPSHQRAELRDERRERTERAIDVEPGPFLLAQRRECAQIVRREIGRRPLALSAASVWRSAFRSIA